MATVVVVGDVAPYEPDEMALAEDDDMLENLAAAAPDPTLGGSVLPKGCETKYEQALCP